jgi:hypothetical protein
MSIILVSLMGIDIEWFLYYVFAVIALFGIMYVLCVSCCISILLSCRNHFYYKLDQRNKALKKIYFELKSINYNGLHCFALHPRVSFENSTIIVDMNYKITASDNYIDGSDGMESLTPSATLPLQMSGVTNRRCGSDGDGPGGSEDKSQRTRMEKTDLYTPLIATP